jgi:hypothetical protein
MKTVSCAASPPRARLDRAHRQRRRSRAKRNGGKPHAVDAATALLRAYFRGVGEEDLAERARDPGVWRRSIISSSAAPRAPGNRSSVFSTRTPARRLRVTPHARHGRHRRHALSGRFTRHRLQQAELAVHLIVHPVLAVGATAAAASRSGAPQRTQAGPRLPSRGSSMKSIARPTCAQIELQRETRGRLSPTCASRSPTGGACASAPLKLISLLEQAIRRPSRPPT